MSKVEIFIYVDRCVYVNSSRIAGGKPYASENLKSNVYSVSSSEILDQLDFSDIEKYVNDKKGGVNE